MSHRKIRDLIDRIKKSKQLKFIVIGILILALILTVYLAQKQQEIRQHANTNQATITVNPLTAKPEESVMVSWTLASASTTVIPSPNASPASLLAFVFTGESNAGGYGLNDAATADELAPTSAVKILNNTTLQFEDLDVGTNNTIDHWNGPTSTFHGFELGLANSVKVHAFPNNPQVYLIKTGQGNSFISQWNSDHTFWQKFVQRTSAAKTQLPTNTPTQWVVWISLGINDNNIGTSPTTFKTDMLGYINKIKADLPGAIIIMTQFQAMGSPRNGYDTVMQELADSEQNVSVVDTTGSSNDGSHWTYAGNKELATKMVTITKNSLDRLYPTATISPTMTQNTFTGAETLQLYALPPASESAQIQSAGPKMYLHCQYPDLPEVGAHPAPPSAPIFTGQCAYHIPSDVNPGSYIIRMLAADGTTILGESGPFTVGPIMQKHPTSFSLFLSLSGIGSSSGELTPQHPLR
ncbi:MAG: hypothetical protein KBD46_03900, partial [Candidatus Levybacteria bacterium]|nr:hypothetical protein [Candidatus Levybacteria bacterium]